MRSEEIGTIIREARIATGMTQAKVAARAGVSEPTVRNYEKGRTGGDKKTLVLLAKALDIQPERVGLTIADLWDDPNVDRILSAIAELREVVVNLCGPKGGESKAAGRFSVTDAQ